MNRRAFLKGSGIAMFGVGSAPLWLARASAQTTTRRKVLVAVFQRGAADGLNVVIPYGDAQYYRLRPTIAIPQASVIDLDGFYGLHPSLAPLKPIYQAGQLAIVAATGSPDPTRSHFDAQDYMESGTPGRKGTTDGWLNRSLSKTAKASPVRAVAVGQQLPRTLRGEAPAVAINSLGSFRIANVQAQDTFESMYADTMDRMLAGTGKDTFEAVRMLDSITKAPYVPADGARYPNGRFGQSLQQIARLIKADVGLEVAFADMGGWDTHVNEVGAQATVGPLANLLAEWGQALAAFHRDLGDRMEDVVLVTMSEFGRTAHENGNRGTDHGHANVMFALGGGVKGGKVHGQWPGLQPEQLHEGRDLAVTTDFRHVLYEVVTGQLAPADNTRIFPGYFPAKRLGIFSI
jgi:uncharacterized protein (DUF1501 family)